MQTQKNKNPKEKSAKQRSLEEAKRKALLLLKRVNDVETLKRVLKILHEGL